MNNTNVEPYEKWRATLLGSIDALPNTVDMGNAFVRTVLQGYYNLSEEDAINATAFAGAGDRGVDALHIVVEEDGEGAEALVLQGKYGTAGAGLHVYDEATKFLSALKMAREGQSVTEAVDKAEAVIRNGGIVRYVVATVDPLDARQREDLANVQALAHRDFGDRLVTEALNVETLYDTLAMDQRVSARIVNLPCKVVEVPGGAHVGAASVADVYTMLRSYAAQAAGGDVNAIYDRNIRKYLKRRPGTVNDGIHHTLKDEPRRFVAYNNGITIVCDEAKLYTGYLKLTNPSIVNGCQTTRTLFDYMSTAFAGVLPDDPQNRMAAYAEAYLAIKVLVVGGTDGDAYANNITRFSNKQNGVRGKDFIALEDMYRALKRELEREGYFLETQAGEYDALTPARKQRYQRGTHVVNSFEATLAYAAGMRGKPHLAFGRSIAFTPGGQEFDELVRDLRSDDLLVPWLIANHAKVLGYTSTNLRDPQPSNRHRVQTRYLFLYLFFRILRETLRQAGLRVEERSHVYEILKPLEAEYRILTVSREQHPFGRLLRLADLSVVTYMRLAERERWFLDRNSYLKRDELINETRITQATGAADLEIPEVAAVISGYTPFTGA